MFGQNFKNRQLIVHESTMNILNLYFNAGFNVTTKKLKNAKKGTEYGGPCPFCGGDSQTSDRFRIWPELNTGNGGFWCRSFGAGCGKGGDNIYFYSLLKNISYKKAAAALGLLIPNYENKKFVKKESIKFEEREKLNPADKWKNQALKIVNAAHEELLQKHDKIILWLNKRGIKIETIKKFKLGYLDQPVFRSRAAWGLPEKKREGRILKFCVQPGLIIPMIKNDEVKRIRIRLKEPKNQKYLPVEGGANSDPTLYSAINRYFIIIESDLCGMLIAQEAGDLVSVLATGATSYFPLKNQMEFLNKSTYILCAQDFEKNNAGAKTAKRWMENFKQSIRWPVPMGKDPSEAFELGLNIRNWIYSGLPPAAKIKRQLSRVHKDFKKGKAVLEIKDQEENKNISCVHPDIKKLYELIKDVPVKIIWKIGLYSVKFDDWYEKKNKKKACLISALCFSEYCDKYLSDHPAEVIFDKNFWR